MESDVEGMGYLQAVVKEMLRRHPSSHFVLSHTEMRETELGGYRISADASMEFYTAMEDPSVWEKPVEWRRRGDGLLASGGEGDAAVTPIEPLRAIARGDEGDGAGGYRIPTDVSVEFYRAWVTEDPRVWEKLEEWRPELFEDGGNGWETDVTGTRGLRMMSFGVGRRICSAAMLGLLHVQLMRARMVREFRWVAVLGERPDPTETFAFIVVMKNSLRAAIVERD